MAHELATKKKKSRVLLAGGTVAAGDEPARPLTAEWLTVGRSEAADLWLDDPEVSALHCELAATPDGVVLRDLSSTNGTFVAGVRLAEGILTEACEIQVGDSRLAFMPSPYRQPDLSLKSEAFGGLVGQSAAMQRLYRALESVAPTELSVLITGETGSGKEVVARQIHEASERSNQPFVVVDCAALPATLAESVLFGHEEGAFTGASQRTDGAFTEANGGTVFLDELGELPIDLQPKLLRVIAERSVKRVGSNRYDPIDVRVLAATRRDLRREMNERRFREDLFFRLAQIQLELPPLRGRIEDVPLLVEEACRRVGRDRQHHRVVAYIEERFGNYDWPGNVRELVNVASVLASLGSDAPEDLLPVERRERQASEPSEFPRRFPEAKRQFEHDYFSTLLEATDQNLSEVARRCGLARHQVRAHLRKLGLWR